MGIKKPPAKVVKRVSGQPAALELEDERFEALAFHGLSDEFDIIHVDFVEGEVDFDLLEVLLTLESGRQIRDIRRVDFHTLDVKHHLLEVVSSNRVRQHLKRLGFDLRSREVDLHALETLDLGDTRDKRRHKLLGNRCAIKSNLKKLTSRN